MATPALRALREGLPGERIVYGCRPYVRALLEGLPWHDEVLLEADGRWAGIRDLRAGRFDAAVLMPSSFGSAFAAWAAGIPRRVGHAGHGRSCLLTDVLPARAAPSYMGGLYLELAGRMGCRAEAAPMALPASGAQEARAEAIWTGLGLAGRRVAGLVPGAAYGSAKCWPPGHFATLARLLRERMDGPALLLCGPGEAGIAEAIRAGAPGAVVEADPSRVDLGVLKALVRRLAVAVTNDTGPRHIAEAQGVPTVTLVGPMDPRYTDSGNPRVTVLREPVDCSPCNRRACPIDHRCLVRITPERVMAAVGAALGRTA